MIFGSLSGIILILFRKGAGRHGLAPFLLSAAARGGDERMGIKMEKFTEMINALDSWLWGLPMIVLLLSGVIAKETRHYLANLDEKDTTEIPVVRR